MKGNIYLRVVMTVSILAMTLIVPLAGCDSGGNESSVKSEIIQYQNGYRFDENG